MQVPVPMDRPVSSVVACPEDALGVSEVDTGGLPHDLSGQKRPRCVLDRTPALVLDDHVGRPDRQSKEAIDDYSEHDALNPHAAMITLRTGRRHPPREVCLPSRWTVRMRGR